MKIIVFAHALVGNKNTHDDAHGKLQAEGFKCLHKDKLAEFVQVVPLYFPYPTRISEMLPIVFI